MDSNVPEKIEWPHHFGDADEMLKRLVTIRTRMRGDLAKIKGARYGEERMKCYMPVYEHDWRMHLQEYQQIQRVLDAFGHEKQRLDWHFLPGIKMSNGELEYAVCPNGDVDKHKPLIDIANDGDDCGGRAYADNETDTGINLGRNE